MPLQISLEQLEAYKRSRLQPPTQERVPTQEPVQGRPLLQLDRRREEPEPVTTNPLLNYLPKTPSKSLSRLLLQPAVPGAVQQAAQGTEPSRTPLLGQDQGLRPRLQPGENAPFSPEIPPVSSSSSSSSSGTSDTSSETSRTPLLGQKGLQSRIYPPYTSRLSFGSSHESQGVLGQPASSHNSSTSNLSFVTQNTSGDSVQQKRPYLSSEYLSQLNQEQQRHGVPSASDALFSSRSSLFSSNSSSFSPERPHNIPSGNLERPYVLENPKAPRTSSAPTVPPVIPLGLPSASLELPSASPGLPSASPGLPSASPGLPPASLGLSPGTSSSGSSRDPLLGQGLQPQPKQAQLTRNRALQQLNPKNPTRTKRLPTGTQPIIPQEQSPEQPPEQQTRLRRNPALRNLQR